MRSRHLDGELADGLAPSVRREERAQPLVAHVPGPVIGLVRDAVRHVAARHSRQDVLHVRVIDAQRRKPVEGDAVDELDEGVLDVLVRAVVVEVLGVDVRDDGDRRRELEERAIALVGLRDEQVARSEPGVRPERVDLTADDDRRGRGRPGGGRSR